MADCYVLSMRFGLAWWPSHDQSRHQRLTFATYAHVT